MHYITYKYFYYTNKHFKVNYLMLWGTLYNIIYHNIK